MRPRLILWLAFAHVSVLITSHAYGDEKSLLVGEVKAIEIPFDIRSILNGSDEVVNLNVDGPRTIVMTGMTPGRTNLIILGSQKEKLDFSLTVSSDQRDLVYLHEGAATTVTFKCEERCLREDGGGESSSPLEAALPSTDGGAATK